MILDDNYSNFLDDLAGPAPVPGGGSASAAVGAAAAALCSMVASLTTGKKKYAQYEEDIQRILKKSRKLVTEISEMADADARAFRRVSEAYKLPKNTPEEKAYKSQVMERALDDASMAPMALMEKMMEAVALIEEVSQKGSVMAISDAGAAAVFARAAIQGAAFNIFINTKSMQDREKAEKLNQKADDLIQEAVRRTDQVTEYVTWYLKK